MGRVELERSLSTLDIWLIVFGVFVAIGVVGESVAGFLHWRRSGQLQTLQTTENLALQKAVADANTRALDAQLALEKFKAPRRLTPEQIIEIAEKLKAFAGQQFSGMVAGSVPDARDLWISLDKVLRAANWVRVPPWGLSTGDPPAGIPVAPNEGVTLFVPTADVADLAPAANALDSILNRSGIKTVGAPDAGPQARPKVIVIEVGTKPQ